MHVKICFIDAENGLKCDYMRRSGSVKALESQHRNVKRGGCCVPVGEAPEEAAEIETGAGKGNKVRSDGLLLWIPLRDLPGMER